MFTGSQVMQSSQSAGCVGRRRDGDGEGAYRGPVCLHEGNR